MRKFTLLWLWLIGTICMAKPITVEKAKAISAKFMAQHVTTTRALSANQLQIKHVFRSETTNAALCYVVLPYKPNISLIHSILYNKLFAYIYKFLYLYIIILADIYA